MTAERWAKLRMLLERAIALPPADRPAFLRHEADDDDLVAEALRLLACEGEATAMFGIENWHHRSTMRPARGDNLAGTVIGSYRLLSELGRGGMGAVYLAERADGVYQQTVAIKILRENIFTAALSDRFKQERQILARLRHPGIARLLDGGVMPDGRPYLVLEYIDGSTINAYCDDKLLDLTDRLRLFLRVADVVQSAHQQLVLHLDLKPANILVTQEGDPRLLDFGIARILNESIGDSAQTETTLRLLTPRYASPEQAEGAPLSVASDVFSLGTLLYQLLTGKLPYPIEDVPPLEAARIIREVPPLLPSRSGGQPSGSDLRGDLDTILLQALRKEPERRYPTVAAFAADVQRYLASEPVLAHADSFNYRAGKFLRRNRAAVIAGTAAAIILLISGAAVVHSDVVAQRERATAERRLKGMRELAHSYVFDLDPRLEDLPGSVGIRDFVLQNAQKYLEAMSHEAVEDDDLARETAQGYSRIAEVQETLAMPSLSNHVASKQSIAKALVIQQHLVDKHPADVTERGLLIRQRQHLATMYAFEGDIVSANRVLIDTWEIGQPLRLVHPTPPRFTDLAAIAWDVAWTNVGNGDLWNLADPDTAMVWLDRAREITARHQAEHNDPQSRLQVASLLERIDISRAAALTQLGRITEVGPIYEDALRVTTLTKHNLNEEEMRRQIRLYYVSYLLSIHDVRHAEALAPFLMPPEFHEKDRDRIPTGDEADELALLARIDFETGRVEAGKQKMERALRTLEALYASAPTDAGVSSELAWDTFRLAEESVLDAPTRRHLYQRTNEIAASYTARHPQVLSASMLIGKSHLGLARMAQSKHDLVGQHANATAAAEQFVRVLAARSAQSEAARLLTQATELSAK
ncbi:MAG: serine/threonine-protein kinase [Acidobacteriota bacterium]